MGCFWSNGQMKSTQAYWKNTLVAIFLQKDITLLLAHFATLPKWNVQWVMSKLCTMVKVFLGHNNVDGSCKFTFLWQGNISWSCKKDMWCNSLKTFYFTNTTTTTTNNNFISGDIISNIGIVYLPSGLWFVLVLYHLNLLQILCCNCHFYNVLGEKRTIFHNSAGRSGCTFFLILGRDIRNGSRLVSGTISDTLLMGKCVCWLCTGCREMMVEWSSLRQAYVQSSNSHRILHSETFCVI